MIKDTMLVRKDVMGFLCRVLRCYQLAYAGKLCAFTGCEGSMHRPA